MRKNTMTTAAAFLAGEPNHESPTISTDGRTIYSYAAAIATKLDDGRVALNITQYSPTTSQQQRDLARILTGAGIALVPVTGFTRICTADQIAAAATRPALLRDVA